jgi:hypothetical protein
MMEQRIVFDDGAMLNKNRVKDEDKAMDDG